MSVYNSGSGLNYLRFVGNAFTASSTWTTMVWIQYDSGNAFITTRGTSTQQFSDALRGSPGGNVIDYYVFDSKFASTTGAASTTVPIKDVWYHVAGTRVDSGSVDPNTGLTSSLGVCRLYINGKKYPATGSCGLGFQNGFGNTNFYVGFIGAGNALGGAVSDVAVWNTCLTDEEVAKIGMSKRKGMPLQIQKNRLLIYLPCVEYAPGKPITSSAGVGPTLFDMSGNNWTQIWTINNTSSVPVGRAEPLNFP